MSISILEKNSCISDENTPDKEYKIGQSLVELVKSDFSNLDIFLHKEIPKNTTFENYFCDLFKINYDSIYFKLLKNTLINFYDNYEDSIVGPKSTPFPYRIIEDPYEFMQELCLFFQPLFIIQKDAEEILLCLASSDKNNKVEKLSALYALKPNLFNLTKYNADSIYYKYDALFNESMISINNDIIFKNHFSNIESLYFFELKRLLKSDTKIIVCPVCKRLHVAKHKKQEYCSNSCKYENNKKSKNTNIFYILYRKRYKSLHSNYSVKKLDESPKILPKEITTALTNLLYEYISKDENDETIIKEYEKKLRAIK